MTLSVLREAAMRQSTEVGAPNPAPATELAQPRKCDAPNTKETICCGVPMVPELARARDANGQEFFIAVWCCERCGKLIS